MDPVELYEQLTALKYVYTLLVTSCVYMFLLCRENNNNGVPLTVRTHRCVTVLIMVD